MHQFHKVHERKLKGFFVGIGKVIDGEKINSTILIDDFTTKVGTNKDGESNV